MANLVQLVHLKAEVNVLDLAYINARVLRTYTTLTGSRVVHVILNEGGEEFYCIIKPKLVRNPLILQKGKMKRELKFFLFNS